MLPWTCLQAMWECPGPHMWTLRQLICLNIKKKVSSKILSLCSIESSMQREVIWLQSDRSWSCLWRNLWMVWFGYMQFPLSIYDRYPWVLCWKANYNLFHHNWSSTPWQDRNIISQSKVHDPSHYDRFRWMISSMWPVELSLNNNWWFGLIGFLFWSHHCYPIKLFKWKNKKLRCKICLQKIAFLYIICFLSND